MFYGSGFLCSITGAPIAGRWTLRLTNDTDFLLTAPDAEQAQGSMQDGDTNSFGSQVAFFLGVNPNGARNIGKFMTVSRVGIAITNANTTNAISSDFTTGAPLDEGTWSILADDPASIIVMPSNSVLRASWPNAAGAGVGPNSLLFTNALTGPGNWPALPAGTLLGDGTNLVFVTRDYTTNRAGFFRVSVPYNP
jgi:hypothetical protein